MVPTSSGLKRSQYFEDELSREKAKWRRKIIFIGTELDFEEIVEIPEGYEKAELRDFEDGTLITGRPEMSSVTSYTFDDDGEEKTVNRF